MTIRKVWQGIVLGLLTMSVVGGRADCLWAQPGSGGQYRSSRDPSNFVGPLRDGPNFNRPVRFGQQSQNFQPPYRMYDPSFDEALQRQERLWYLQERALYQSEHSRMLPDPNFIRPGTRPHSLFRR